MYIKPFLLSEEVFSYLKEFSKGNSTKGQYVVSIKALGAKK